MSRPWKDSESLAEAVGGRILEARERAGLSQRQTVDGTGYSAAYLSAIERGQRMPSVKFMRAVGPRLGASVVWIETGDDLVDVRLPADVAAAIARGRVPSQARPALIAACRTAFEEVAA